MSQTFTAPVDGDDVATAIKTTLTARDSALRSCFSGSTAPTETVAGQFWYDTATGWLMQRNAGNTDWEYARKFGQANATRARLFCGELRSVSASDAIYLVPMLADATVVRVVLVCDTATTSSGSNEWQFELENLTQTLDLFSAAVGHDTALAGVGGGSDFVGDEVYELTPNQNADVDADDVLEFRLTKVGTVTTLVRLSVFLEVELR